MPRAPLETHTLSQQAYQALHADILSGAFEPGSRLRIDTLKERYSIGPTPLREALARLAAQGFLDSEENRGFSIPVMTLADLRDVTNQRKLIECSALRQSIERLDVEFEARVVAAYHRMSRFDDSMRNNPDSYLEDWEKHHRAFHQVLISGAGSPWLSRFQSVLYDQADRYRRLYLPHTSLPNQVFDDHRLLLEATLNRDADAACALMESHIERVYEIGAKSGLFRAD